MKQFYRRLLTVVLVISLLLPSCVSAFAAAKEEYLCELRLVYAESYSEAKEILKDNNYKDYVVLNENLNEDTDEIGVWLAYKTTTDIEDAITDLSVMQMQGGYSEGNYQQMLQESYDEYLAVGKIYLQAIEYFVEAYDAGDYLAEVAYRQLNFYTVETVGKTAQKPHPFEGELLGDIFYEGIDDSDLATLFMQGNVYALQNVRSLLAMGVSYNEDGLTYVEKVAQAAAAMSADPTAFEGDALDDLLPNISAVLNSLREQFKRLEAVEKEFNWEDEVFTEEELEFAEIALIATLMRDTEYLDGKSLYDFCKEYKSGVSNSKLYPLAAALNPGQAALTKVCHFYDVIRYSFSDMSSEVIEEKLAEQEEIYAEEPFNLYAGVDRSIFDGSFALTTAASRANEMNEYSLEEILFGDAAGAHMTVAVSAGAIGLGITVYALCRTIYYKTHMVNAADAAGGAANMAMADALKKAAESVDSLATKVAANHGDLTYGQLVDNIINNNLDSINSTLSSLDSGFDLGNYTTLSEKLDMLDDWVTNADDVLAADLDTLDDIALAAKEANKNAFTYDFNDSYSYSKVLYGGGTTLTTVLYIAGGAMMLYSAITMGITIYNYYHPDYDDIPTAMVDMIETADGDRFVKYDAVLEAEPKTEGEQKGICVPGDLNAFAGRRWNALYYTKSYEAGKPLLADEFSVSNTNNKPKTNYAPVHRFGEVVCYDLNKYCFEDDTGIYLSVKQSKNQKAAVAAVPQVVGSIFTDGLWLIAGGIGALVGVGATIGTQSLLKKKQEEAEEA